MHAPGGVGGDVWGQGPLMTRLNDTQNMSFKKCEIISRSLMLTEKCCAS